MWGRTIGTFLVIAGVVLPSRGFAQSATDMAARSGLLQQAQSASEAGDHARALDLGLRAGAIQWTPSLRLFVAQEQQHVGQVAAGLGNAQLCAREANDDPQLANRETILQTCRELAASLQPRVGHVVVDVPSPAPAGLDVRVGSEALNPAFYGVDYPVDPGSVHVAATATGAAPFATDVTVAAGQTQDVEVQLTPAPGGGTSATPATSGSPAGNTAPPSSQGSSGPGIAPFIVAGAGVVVFATSGIWFALQQQSLSHCTDAGPGAVTCSPGDSSDAHTWNALTNTALIAGGVITLAGVGWYLVARFTSHPSDVHAAFAPLQSGGMLTVGGSL